MSRAFSSGKRERMLWPGRIMSVHGDTRFMSAVKPSDATWETSTDKGQEASQGQESGLRGPPGTHVSPLCVGAMLALEAGHETLVGMVTHGTHRVQSPLDLKTQRTDKRSAGLGNQLSLLSCNACMQAGKSVLPSNFLALRFKQKRFPHIYSRVSHY